MKNIGKFCNLSHSYTNHCLRVSCCSILGEHHSENDIKCVSGHSSNSDLGIYKRIQENKKVEMSMNLATTLEETETNVSTNNDTYDVSSFCNDGNDKWLMNEVLKVETPQFAQSCSFNNCNVTINVQE